MISHRLACLLVLGAATAAVTLAPRDASAQIMTVASRQLSSHSWMARECSDLACIRDMIQNEFSLTFVPVGANADMFARADAFVASNDLSAFVSDCPACKVSSRPFFIPPGLLFQLTNQHGGPPAVAVNGKSHAGGSAGDESNGVVTGSVSVVDLITPNGGAGAPGSMATLTTGGAADVTTNPEPATLALMATGLFGLIPVVARRRRSH